MGFRTILWKLFCSISGSLGTTIEQGHQIIIVFNTKKIKEIHKVCEQTTEKVFHERQISLKCKIFMGDFSYRYTNDHSCNVGEHMGTVDISSEGQYYVEEITRQLDSWSVAAYRGLV